MTETTKKILEAAFLADQTATEEERTAFKQLVNGGRGDKKTMIPTRQACEMLGCTRQTLRAYELKGRIKAVRISARRVRFDKAEIEGLLTEGAAL